MSLTRKRNFRSCFVVMPFGKKTVGDSEVDFDTIFKEFICPAARGAGFDAVRADTDPNGGLIIARMIERIYWSDLVIADISYYNPNVYWELGCRHALRKHGTLLIRRQGGNFAASPLSGASGTTPASPTPFNITQVPIHDYAASVDTLAAQIKKLTDVIEGAARAVNTDSPVYAALTNLRVAAGAQPARAGIDRTYQLTAAPGTFIGYRSGDIRQLDGQKEKIDFWVNSENTMMQMARMNERSVSSTIRFLGARNPEPTAPDYEDTIADALRKEMGNRRQVELGEVLVTTSGKLLETHKVKAILHAATVTGSPGKGFEPAKVEHLPEIVENVVKKARSLNAMMFPPWCQGGRLTKVARRIGQRSEPGRSLLMPIFGGGQANADPTTIAGPLLKAAIDSLATQNGPVDQRISSVFFSAFSEESIALLQRLCEALAANGELVRVSKGEASA